MSDEKIKHLEFTQDVITRMSSNSFQVKGWMVTVVAASLLSATQNSLFAIGGIIPTLIFWFLDAFYVWQERKFRGLYNDIAGVTKNNKIRLFAMRPDLYKGKKYSFWKVFISKTVLPLYLFVIIILGTVYILLPSGQ